MMSRAKELKRVLERLVDDDYVHEQLGDAARRLRQAKSRGVRRRSKAVEDKKLYAQLREAATSLTKAGRALRGEREHERERKRKQARRRIVVAATLAGGSVAVLLKQRRSKPGEPNEDTATQTATAPESDTSEPGVQPVACP
jgi:hypothetical protein